MTLKTDSVLKSAMRSFVMAFFGFIGLGMGFLILILMFAGALGDNMQLERTTKQKLLTNAQGERKPLGNKGPVILQLNIEGVIGMEQLTTERVRQVLAESREGPLENRIEAILLYINSPGGTARDSRGIRRLIQEYKERHNVPVLAYVDGLCASGGMLIATAADRIVATDGSIIGSVGVLGPTAFNLSAVLERFSIEALTMHAGKGKDALNPFRPWKEGEADFIKKLLDYEYELFVTAMTTSRPKLSREVLINEIGAEVVSAQEAVSVGFIDAMDYDRSRALQELADTAELEADDYHVIALEGKNWVSDLFSSKSAVASGTVTHQLQLLPGMPPELMNQSLYLYLPALTP